MKTKEKKQARVPVQPKKPMSAEKANENLKTTEGLPSHSSAAAISADLRALQRQRAVFVKSRIMVANRLQAIVAGTMGYHSGMTEKERTKAFADAAKLIKAIAKREVASALHSLVMTHQTGIDEFDRMKAELEKSMVKLAKQLPVAAWVEKPEQRGFGLLFLAIVIGETGDLANYANPAKVWKRLGCAPYAFDGHNHMGSTWRFGKEGKLPAAEWEKFGYTPRRRSIAYLIGEGIVKQNGTIQIADETGETETTTGNLDGAVGADEVSVATEHEHVGPYRLRYNETKALIQAAHPDYPKLRCHRHGMLLATKLLLKNLWIEWNHPKLQPTPLNQPKE